MLSSPARSVDEYLSQLPPDRREALSALRRLIRKHLPPGYEEGMQFGMVGYFIPLARYPDTYNGQPLCVVALASQKQYMSLYLMTVYGDRAKERQFAEAFRKAGKTLDMGKSCVRFKALDDLPLETIAAVVGGTSVDDFIALYERIRAAARRKPAARAKSNPAKKKATRKKGAKKKPGKARL
jgi:hypothetical protein